MERVASLQKWMATLEQKDCVQSGNLREPPASNPPQMTWSMLCLGGELSEGTGAAGRDAGQLQRQVGGRPAEGRRQAGGKSAGSRQ